MTNPSTSHLKNATEELGRARDHVVVGVADAVNCSVDAASEVKAAVGENVDSMLDRGRGLVDDAAETIRSKPWKAVGIAVIGGYLLAKFSGRG